jgi:hypothetical protein
MLISVKVAESLCPVPGYFRLGDTTIFGRSTAGAAARLCPERLPDASPHLATHGSSLLAPFDPAEILDNLRYERYVTDDYPGRRRVLSSNPIRRMYYRVRPLLPIAARRHLQRFFLRDWRTLAFPSWPVDTTVEQLQERLLIEAMKARRLDTVPFIWFWPDGASMCVMLTHDVETSGGAAYLPALMDIDDAFGFKAAFQLIPGERYPVSSALRNRIRARGFEVNVHDLTHEGNLFDGRREFLDRARSINRHIREFGAAGFRAGRMYRNLDWYEALEIEYDMSVPNVAHLEPQRGGCCTVFPYFVGNVLELPLTTSQDYSVFFLLGDRSIDLWRKQISIIAGRHGLASFIVHPDYIRNDRRLASYKQLLAHLSDLRAGRNVWSALPGEVNRWWRERSRMALAQEDGKWVVRGAGSERARVAYARISGDRLLYKIDDEN